MRYSLHRKKKASLTFDDATTTNLSTISRALHTSGSGLSTTCVRGAKTVWRCQKFPLARFRFHYHHIHTHISIDSYTQILKLAQYAMHLSLYTYYLYIYSTTEPRTLWKRTNNNISHKFSTHQLQRSDILIFHSIENNAAMILFALPAHGMAFFYDNKFFWCMDKWSI